MRGGIQPQVPRRARCAPPRLVKVRTRWPMVCPGLCRPAQPICADTRPRASARGGTVTFSQQGSGDETGEMLCTCSFLVVGFCNSPYLYVVPSPPSSCLGCNRQKLMSKVCIPGCEQMKPPAQNHPDPPPQRRCPPSTQASPPATACGQICFLEGQSLPQHSNPGRDQSPPLG